MATNMLPVLVKQSQPLTPKWEIPNRDTRSLDERATHTYSDDAGITCDIVE